MNYFCTFISNIGKLYGRLAKSGKGSNALHI